MIISYNFKPYDIKSGEKYMSENQMQHFKSILEHWKKELESEVSNIISDIDEMQELTDPSDQASQEETLDLELTTRDRQRNLIIKIENALQQIDSKNYGYCESCGVGIGVARLEANPIAAMCIDCKRLDELRSPFEA